MKSMAICCALMLTVVAVTLAQADFASSRKVKRAFGYHAALQPPPVDYHRSVINASPSEVSPASHSVLQDHADPVRLDAAPTVTYTLYHYHPYHHLHSPPAAIQHHRHAVEPASLFAGSASSPSPAALTLYHHDPIFDEHVLPYLHHHHHHHHDDDPYHFVYRR